MNFDFLIPPLIGAVLSAILAAIISLFDGLVNNYGNVKIDINNGKKSLEVKGGSPLLTTLSGKEIFIPSACGGRGTCGVCKIKITSDVGPVFPTEIPYLSKEELSDKVRLSCQVKVKKNISINIPEELFFIKQYDTVISSIKNVTYDIKEIKFKLQNPDRVNFKPGQYLQFESPPYEKIKDATQRAYSISSAPSNEEIELLIRLVPGGIVTTYVFYHLKNGSRIKLIGPFGEFYVRDTEADMICVAGGSGMAPFKSILYDMLEKGKTERNIWFFFGARSKKDLFYVDEFREMEIKWKSFRFIPALSEPQPEDKWEGDTGLITAVLDKYFKTIIVKNNAKEGYLCGSPGMIDASIKVMIENGIPQEKIYYDKF